MEKRKPLTEIDELLDGQGRRVELGVEVQHLGQLVPEGGHDTHLGSMPAGSGLPR